MNVYDFDGTIYDGDSTVDFYWYCLRKHPKTAAYAPRQALGVFLRAARQIDTARMKEQFFSFLNGLGEGEALADSFWDERQSKIKRWYLDRKRETDVIISASPEFLLRPICRRLGVQPPIATRMDPRSGKIQGRNCKGAEKVSRFTERFPEGVIRQFYSDSMTDAPMAALAGEAFFIKADDVLPWPGHA